MMDATPKPDLSPQQRRLVAAKAEIDEVCERHGVLIVSRAEITEDGRIAATVGLVLRPSATVSHEP